MIRHSRAHSENCNDTRQTPTSHRASHHTQKGIGHITPTHGGGQLSCFIGAVY